MSKPCTAGCPRFGDALRALLARHGADPFVAMRTGARIVWSRP